MTFNNRKMKICFYARAGQLKLYVKIANMCREKDVDFVFVTQNKTETEYVGSNVENGKVYEIEEYLRVNWNNSAEPAAKVDLDEYSDINLWRMLYTDRFLVNYSTTDCIKMINLHFQFFEDLFMKEDPQYFINEAVATFAAYVAMEVGNRYGCTYVGTIIARDNANKQFFFLNDLYQKNIKMETLYNNGEFNLSEIQEANDYLRAFRAGSKSPAYMMMNGRRPRLTIKHLLYPIKYFIDRHKRIYHDKAAYMTYGKAYELINAPLLDYVRYECSRKYYQKPVEGDSYYLLPLHYQPEASTLVCAQKYEKQLFVIDNLAKSIPSNSLLYVKEHYAHVGHRQIHFYRELLKYPNVRLIDPYVDIHSLIVKSLAVIVLTSTTGFEAILRGKKVFVLGEVFYDFFENVDKLADPYNDYLRLKNIQPKVSDDRIVRFLCAYRRSLYKGCVSPVFKEFLTDENVNDLIDSFESYIMENDALS